ncbi:MAG: trifunctional transcriptional activator/DNA repair protein Ada/methylated-DNA--[protein]-cysteine S-methyltransferase, partial [Pseudomonadota bacterium]
VGVKTTGIFCRLTCPARKPKRENCEFFDNVAGCLYAGFRPCKRFEPLRPAGELAPTIKTLIDALEADPSQRWTERAISDMGFDPSTVRRQFRQQFGITFLEMARLRRLRHGAKQLGSGARVIDAQLDAGFESASGFRDALARLMNVSPSGLARDAEVRASWIETPVGPMIAAASNSALHVLEFYDCKDLPRELAALSKKRGTVGLGETDISAQIAQELGEYFEGKRHHFDTPVDGLGSDFTRGVWQELTRIPYGTTLSYGELAQRIGNRKASRAVARANGSNPVAVIVPCHRVIAADGSLSGYAGGRWRKRWLLDHERKHAT